MILNIIEQLKLIDSNTKQEDLRKLDYEIFKLENDYNKKHRSFLREAVLYKDGWTEEYGQKFIKTYKDINNTFVRRKILGPILLRNRKEKAIDCYRYQYDNACPNYTIDIVSAKSLIPDSWESIGIIESKKSSPIATVSYNINNIYKSYHFVGYTIEIAILQAALQGIYLERNLKC